MLIGDLNARVGEETGTLNSVRGINRQAKDKVCNAKGKKLIELCDSFGLRILNGTSLSDEHGNFTFVGGQGSSIIDYSIVGEEWETYVTDFEVNGVPYSDHFPVVVTFNCDTNERTQEYNSVVQLTPKLKWNMKRAPTYRRLIDSKLQTQNEMDFNKLESIIKTSYPQQRPKKKLVCKEPWFDQECQISRDKSFSWLRAFRNSSEEQYKQNYLEANKEYKRLCKMKKQRLGELQANKLAKIKDASEFWRLAWKMNGKTTIAHKMPENDLLREHFKTLLSSVTSSIDWHYAAPDFKVEVLDQEITLQEIETALTGMKDGKASGSNGISVEFYKYGTVNLKQNLVTLYNKVLEGELTPSEFKESIIFPIYKKGNVTDPSNYRGISFQNATYKIYTTVLQNRLTKWIDSKNLLKEFQAGFRANYSTIDNIFILRSLAEHFISKNKKLYAFFVDFKAAFDTIDRRALFYKLYCRGLSRKYGRALEELYKDTKAAVWNGSEMSNWFDTLTGVRQGCSLSPTLFSLFIDDLIDSIPGGVDLAGVNIKALLFADDVVLFAYTPNALQLMINRLYEYCQLWNLIVNIDKSKIMIFKRGGGRTSLNERWNFNGQVIEIVSEYKYLGIYFTKNLSLTKHFKEKLEKSKTAINISWRSCFMNKNIAHSCKYKVFQAIAETILLYGSQVWGCMKFDAVEQLLRYFIKKIFHLPPNTPNYIIMLETGLSPLFIKTLKLQADYLSKILNMNESRLVRKVVLQTIQDKNGWYDEWLKLAQGCNINLDINTENIGNIKRNLYEIISKVDERCREEFKAEATGSLYRTIYSRLNHNLQDKNYFNDVNNVQHISTMVRLRSELLNLNYIPHRTDLPLECSICNQREREDIIHFVGKCPTLKETRRSILGSDFLTENQVLEVLNQMDVPRLYQFCKIALKYRERILSGNF